MAPLPGAARLRRQGLISWLIQIDDSEQTLLLPNRSGIILGWVRAMHPSQWVIVVAYFRGLSMLVLARSAINYGQRPLRICPTAHKAFPLISVSGL